MSDDERKTFRVSEQVPPRFTVEELVQWCIQRDLDPAVVQVSGGHFVYERTETAEQAQARLERARLADERHREWVRERYHTLFPGGE